MAEPEAPKGPSDPFMDAARGHVPLSTNAGSAHTWFPNQPARPDREYNKLWWMSGLGFGSAIGLTDFYLRSPLTGLLKIAIAIVLAFSTAGFGVIGIFLWGLWEFLHIWTEKDRVVEYGLSAPFDLWHGIGQGMVTDKATNYTQRSNFTVWQLTTILGIFGVDSAVVGKYALAARRFFDTIILAGLVAGIWAIIRDIQQGNGSFGGEVFGLIVLIPLAAFFASCVLIPLVISMKAAATPTKMFKDGIQIGNSDKLLNFFSTWTKRIGEEVDTGVRSDFGFANVSADDLRYRFDIRHRDSPEPPAPPHLAPTRGDTGVLSFFLGNLIVGPILTLLTYIPNVNLGINMTYGNALGALTGMVPGGVAEMVPAVSNLKRGLTAAVPGLGAVEGVLSAPAAALEAATAVVPGPLSAEIRTHVGGARSNPKSESLSTEAIALGATVAALIAGGAIKLAADSLVTK